MQSADYRRRLVRTSVPGVYKRGGAYVVRYRDPSGRARKRSARTLAEARRLKAELTTDVSRGEWRAQSRVTFTEYARDWIRTYQGRTEHGIREETREDYRKRLEQDAIPFFGRMRLAEIGPRDVKRFAAHVAARGVRPGTVRLALAPVKALMATAVEEELIRSNPTVGVRLAQATKESADDEEQVKALTEDQLRRLLDEVTAEPGGWRLFFEFLAHTGLRIGEAVALRWRDVDLGRCRVRVRRRFYRGGFAPPKSKYGRRDVPLSPGMARALWRIRDGRGDEELVFTSEKGRLVDQSNLASRVLKPAARRAGVPWASFHTFRHTCATVLFRAGLNAKQVQLWLGHHSPAFTLATYVHLIPEDLPNADFLDPLTAAPADDADATAADALAEAGP